MNEIYWDTITEDMREVMASFAQNPISEKFYLAGGTALALQLGHRRSDDLDFFSPTEDIPTLRAKLAEALSPFNATLADSAWGNLVFLAKDVRVGFYGYGFPLVDPLFRTDSIHLASIEDIALMKLDALLSRASRKDFYDLYFICQRIHLRDILNKSQQKYSSIRDFETQTVKRLVFFDYAERGSDPVLLQPVEWQAVKVYFVNLAKEIEQSWLK